MSWSSRSREGDQVRAEYGPRVEAGAQFLQRGYGVAAERGLLFQAPQPDIDARQSLGDFVLQISAHLFSFVLLRHQKLAGQKPQLLLHAARLLQQLAIVLFTFPEGFLRRLALGDFLFQLPIGGGQIHAAPAQLLDHLIQLDFGLARGAMSVLDRGDGLGKKPPGGPVPGDRPPQSPQKPACKSAIPLPARKRLCR